VTQPTVEQAREGATLRGRFALFGKFPNLTLAWASDLCDRCQDCDCGSQQEPIKTADLLKQMMANPVEMIRAIKAGRHGDT
jgi:hypothetical protein